MEVLLTSLEILFCSGQLSPALTEGSHKTQEPPPRSEHSWGIREFSWIRAQLGDQSTAGVISGTPGAEHRGRMPSPTSIDLTFPPHSRELFVGVLPCLGGGGDQVVVDIPLNPTPLAGIFSFFLKTEKREQRSVLSSAFSHGTGEPGYLCRKLTNNPSLLCSPSAAEVQQGPGQLGFHTSLN